MNNRNQKIFLATLIIGAIFIGIFFMPIPVAHAIDDNTPPQLISFTSTTPDGMYFYNGSINITANFDEDLCDPSSMTIVLDNGESVVLSMGGRPKYPVWDIQSSKGLKRAPYSFFYF